MSNTIMVNVKDGILEVSGENQDWVRQVESEILDKFFDSVKEHIRSAPREISTIPSTVDVTQVKNSNIKSTSKKVVRNRQDRNVELESKLTADEKEKLDKFIQERKAAFDKSQPAQAAIIAYFLLQK